MKRLLSFAFTLVPALLTQTTAAAPLPRRDFDEMPATSRVVMETSAGRIVLELYADKAPITVKNFLQYADDQHYDGTIFHRVIADFMLQGGGYLPGMKEKKTRDPIKYEAGNGLSNVRGTIAAARIHANPDSATAQFFINTKDNVFLDRDKSSDKVGYAVFGRVVEGMETIERIRRSNTAVEGMHADVPVEPIVILSVRRAVQ